MPNEAEGQAAPQQVQEPTPQPTPEVAPETDFGDFIDEMPEQPKQDEPKEFKEQAENQEPKQDEPKDSQEPKEPVEKIKIGENEYTPEEVKAFEESHRNYETWRKNLTQKSQIAANLTDDQLTAIMKVTDNLRKVEVPEAFDSPVKEIDFQSEEPFVVEMEDADGLPAEVDIKPYLKPFVQQYESKIKELEGQLQEVEGQSAEIARQNILTEMKTNMLTFPEISISNLSKDTIDSILTAGVSHPDYDKLMKYKSVASYARDAQIPFDKAYRRLYASEIVEDKEAQRLKNNLKKRPPEPPAKTPPTTDVDTLYNEQFGEDDVYTKIQALP